MRPLREVAVSVGPVAMLIVGLGWLPLLLPACAAQASVTEGPGYRVTDRFPHDTLAYTQGLVADDGVLYESTGRYGESELRRVEKASGAVEAAVPLSPDRFGEGIAVFEGRLYLLTWKAGLAYVFDRSALALVDSLPYDGEGWGLTSDGSSLIMSDGTDRLRFLDPVTFEVRRTVEVRYASQTPVTNLNELEFIDGELFANVYQSDWIVRLDPGTGLVHEVLDLAGIMPGHDASSTNDEVLNGIAYDRASGHLLVTGKRWPLLFELELTRPPGLPSRSSGGSR